jgi:hypothetical protein
MTVVTLASLCRISNLDRTPFDIARIPQDRWDTGDYVMGEITASPGANYGIELATGRMFGAMPGNRVIGAFGNRSATLEAVGSWQSISNGKMNALTSAGLFGAITSLSAMIPGTIELDYVGHVVREGRKVCMSDFALGKSTGRYAVPTILIVGTSMSAGKTTTGRVVVHELEKMGMRVIGTKLTGAGRYRDILSFGDAGASAVFDFVDAGLPSTVVPEAQFRDAIRPLLHHIDSLEPDVVVAEAGASPLEPYNGMAAIDELGDNICCTILCASDPYSVVGVQQAFGLKPDLISGPATNTSAAIDLVGKLCRAAAINVMDPNSGPALRKVLQQALDRWKRA